MSSIPKNFNWKNYLKLNEDLTNIKTKTQAIEHYIKYGIKENRIYKINEKLIPQDFNWKEYIFLNNDVKNDKESAFEHYIKYGNKENRIYKIDEKLIPHDFNWEEYIFLNTDLKDLKNNFAAKNHYITYGIKENRKYKLSYDNKYFLYNKIQNIKLSVIIPNYNNEKYLLKRLNTVYNQSYLPDEVIIIDDCSTDNSLKIIKNYIKNNNLSNIDTKIIVNKENSGSGYFNWIKGIELSKNNLIWIAESDDSCDFNFIKKLIPEFLDESVSIAYCRTHFVNDNDETIWKIDDYLDVSWNKNFKKSNSKLLEDKFSYCNIIPNASSCIFRKPNSLIINTLNYYLNQNIRLIIDWMLYLLVSKNSSISYVNDVINYYLVRNDSVSKKIQNSKSYLYEHYQMMIFMINNFNIKNDSINLLYSKLEKHFSEMSVNINDIKSIYKIDELIEMNNLKKNNNVILIFSYGFLIGGGETFPIHLANILYELNQNVIYMVRAEETVNSNIRNLLNKNIRIVNNISNLDNIINDFNITHINTHHQCCDKIIIDYTLKYPNKIKHFITDHGMYNIKSDESKYILKLMSKCKPNVVYINNKNYENFDGININKYKISITIKDYFDYKQVNRKDYNIKNTDFVITLASRCFKEKGWEEMIYIFNLINITHKNVKLLLLGDYNNEYGLSLKNNCNNKNILFLGYQDKIKRFFEISDIGILPTYYSSESNPIVLIECLYAKKPFIVSSIGETPIMLTGDNDFAGTIIELYDGKINIDKYVLEIKKYIDNKEYYNNKLNQIKYALEKFNPTILGNEYVRIFNY